LFIFNVKHLINNTFIVEIMFIMSDQVYHHCKCCDEAVMFYNVLNVDLHKRKSTSDSKYYGISNVKVHMQGARIK